MITRDSIGFVRMDMENDSIVIKLFCKNAPSKETFLTGFVYASKDPVQYQTVLRDYMELVNWISGESVGETRTAEIYVDSKSGLPTIDNISQRHVLKKKLE